MKAQRLKITERGWENYSAFLGSVEFKDGISVHMVSAADAAHIGSIVRCEGIDDDAQVGMGAIMKNTQNTRAQVVKPLVDETPVTTAPAVAATVTAEKYTRESLEAIADAQGINGLRVIGEKYGVKGRGIVELINEILRAQV